MKTKLVVLATAILPLLAGCNEARSEPEVTGGTNVVTAMPAVTNPPAAMATAAPDEAVPAGQVVNTESAPPSSVKLSPAASEIVKLAQAGVDSSVMLAYVTNSVHTFGLAADEIVYLNDLGIPAPVMTAMIQHDQQVREASLAGATVTSPATPAPAQSVWATPATAPATNTWQQPVAEAAPAAQVDTTTTVPPPPAEERPDQTTVNYFYDSLSPYGTWIDIDGYGRCWRPTVVVTYPGWRPYCNGGHWVWTDSGWYWYSDYSWGWAPFHYGRWFSHPRWGWCWMPGSTWGPSWVSWRYSDAYCGWAPLPPAAYYSPSIGFSYFGSSCGVGFSFGLTWDYFTFVSYHDFCGHHYDHHRVPRHEAVQVYNHTTVVNNIIRGNNNTIINQGIAPSRITAATGTAIHPVTIRGVTGVHGGTITRHEAIASDGKTLTVVRANVPGNEHHAVTGGTPLPTRGGAQGLTTGNAAPTNPRHTVPTRTVTPGHNTAGPGAPGNVASHVPNTPQTPAPAATPAPPATHNVAAPTGPWAPASPPRATHPPRSEVNGGALIIRSEPAANTRANTPAPAPAAPVPVRQPATTTTPPRVNTPAATPWLNNTRSQPQPNVKANPANPMPSTWQHTSPWSQNTVRVIRQAPQNNYTPAAPAPVTPPRNNYQAPTYQTPSAPRIERSAPAYSAPAPAQNFRSYSPPATRSYEPPRTYSAPSYSPPRAPAAPPAASHSAGRSYDSGGSRGGGKAERGR